MTETTGDAETTLKTKSQRFSTIKLVSKLNHKLPSEGTTATAAP